DAPGQWLSSGLSEWCSACPIGQSSIISLTCCGAPAPWHPHLPDVAGAAMRSFAKLTVLICLAALALGTARGQSVVETSVPTAAVGEIGDAPVHYRFPLSKFVTTPGPLTLRDAAISTKISVDRKS